MCNLCGVAGSYVDYTCTNTSNRSDVNMEHGDSQGSNSNDTIKIPFQFKPKVRGSQVAERLGNRASNLKVAGSIPWPCKKIVSVGQGTSPYLPLYLL